MRDILYSPQASPDDDFAMLEEAISVLPCDIIDHMENITGYPFDKIAFDYIEEWPNCYEIKIPKGTYIFFKQELHKQ